MEFHSWQFGLSLTGVVCAFWVLANHRAARSWLLLIASYLFYGAWNPWFLGLILFSTALDFRCGLLIDRAATPGRRRAFLALSLAGNLGLLGFFKYSHWLSSLLDPLLASVGLDLQLAPYSWASLVDEGGWSARAVPVGISFYTFQTLSYTIDIYRRELAPTRSLRDFALFVAFFPQLVAGPIVRAVDFLPQLELAPRVDRQRLADGLTRIGIGLAKKALLADTLGRYLVDPCFANPAEYGPWFHLLALYGFTFQIYCDFSGYSDIAIGAARLLGFDLPENFVAPYRSLSVREFWRRWHITLSSWVRDYLFFPLGGSRGPEPRVVLNLMITMVAIGLWHGAGLLWVLYGLLQGAAVSLERAFTRRRRGRAFATSPARRAVAWFLTFHFIVISCLCIRSTSWDAALAMLSDFGAEQRLVTPALLALVAAAATSFLPPPWTLRARRAVERLPLPALGLLLGLLAGVVAAVLSGATPFIYFQF